VPSVAARLAPHSQLPPLRRVREIDYHFKEGPRIDPVTRMATIVAANALWLQLPPQTRGLFAMAEDALTMAILSLATDHIVQRWDKYCPDGTSRISRKQWYWFTTLLPDGQRYANAEIDEKLKAIQDERVANRTDIQFEWSKRWPTPATTCAIDDGPGDLAFGRNFTGLSISSYSRWPANPYMPGYIDYAGAKANRDRLILLRAQEAGQVDATGYALTWRGAPNAYEEAGFQTGPKRQRNERRERPKEVKTVSLKVAFMKVIAETQRPLTNADTLCLPQHERTPILLGTRYKEGDCCPVSPYRPTLPRPKNVTVWLYRDRHGKWRIRPEINWKAREPQTETIPVQADAQYSVLTIGDRETEVGTAASYDLHSFKTKRRVREVMYAMIESVIGHTGDHEITVEDFSGEGLLSSEGNSTLAEANTAPF
jgi:hypothetical protein